MTLKQIAKELSVSISTVSKSLNNSKEISEDTRLKVQAFAKFYNYKPNNIALSLKNKRTQTIAVIIPEIVHHFFATVIKGIENIANERGYNVIICLSDESFDKEVIHMEMLANGSIDGFILSLSKETLSKLDFHHIEEAINQGMPVVMFDRVSNAIPCDKIIINDVFAAQQAVDYLINKNKKQIAILTTPNYVNVGKLRTEGYLQALKYSNIEIEESLILKIDDIAHANDKIYDFLKDNSCEAIFAVNEIFAVHAIKAAKRLNIRVPEDLFVIGFTDGIISQYSTPTITTVGQNEILIGEKAAEALIARIENESDIDEPFQTHFIDTYLIERESTSI